MSIVSDLVKELQLPRLVFGLLFFSKRPLLVLQLALGHAGLVKVAAADARRHVLPHPSALHGAHLSVGLDLGRLPVDARSGHVEEGAALGQVLAVGLGDLGCAGPLAVNDVKRGSGVLRGLRNGGFEGVGLASHPSCATELDGGVISS